MNQARYGSDLGQRASLSDEISDTLPRIISHSSLQADPGGPVPLDTHGRGMSGTGRLTITAQAPCRADLAGSTLDLWPLYLFHPGAITLNFAVNIMASCKITVHPGECI